MRGRWACCLDSNYTNTSCHLCNGPEVWCYQDPAVIFLKFTKALTLGLDFGGNLIANGSDLGVIEMFPHMVKNTMLCILCTNSACNMWLPNACISSIGRILVYSRDVHILKGC